MDRLGDYLLLMIVLQAVSCVVVFGYSYMEYKQLRMPKYLLLVGALSFVYPSLCWLIIAWIVGHELKKRQADKEVISIKYLVAMMVFVQMIAANVFISGLNAPVVDPSYEGELSLVSALFCNVILMCFGLWLNNHLNRLLLAQKTDR